jgi:hypothetical protein
MTWYITNEPAYLAARRKIGSAWRTVMGRHYPAMAAVVVAALIEDRALIEIEAMAVVPESAHATAAAAEHEPRSLIRNRWLVSHYSLF